MFLPKVLQTKRGGLSRLIHDSIENPSSLVHMDRMSYRAEGMANNEQMKIRMLARFAASEDRNRELDKKIPRIGETN